ncbi:MAG: phenylalanine--tRNA ligase subunit alpha [Candidatus Pacebacteria bacterium]|nr:phenylalanine--tRNA ligase subunit alpha [Candidatus Paceibacterota bacterium]MDD4073983.1 phenylalanine--tRNA ligase subunit alpha [Candidatus Paceibacterota bacterium]
MDIEEIKKEAIEKIEKIKENIDLDLFRKEYLGKKGKIRDLFSLIKDLPIEEKKTLGQKINQLSLEIEEIFLLKENSFKKEIKEEIDFSFPAKATELGSLHPITQVRREMENIFQMMGFSVVEGPEIETQWYNFDALNIPEGHPARDALSLGKTFYLKNGNVLRTQTSSAQVRYMQKMKPPIKIIIPGKVYRYETTDASHETNFFQLEGLYIDKNVSVSHLKAILHKFLESFFKRKIEIRLRPSYFPFTEPSVEVDMLCTVCNGKGCAACKKTGWVEILGAGIVHPNVIKNGGIDPKKYKGLAFGLSIDRPTMMKYKINDIRLFHSANLNFLKQF